MRFSVVINNFNYGRYVGEAISSVLAQSLGDYELIVVDDGSSDDSREVVSRYRDPRIRTVFKANGGQLSCFNAAAELVSGEVVCFLDADDLYEPHYLERLELFYREHPDCGCAFCRLRRFGGEHRLSTGCDRVVRWGESAFLTAVLHLPIGAETSACSMKTEIFRRFLPWREGEPEWRIRADDVLLWGAAMCGAVKYFIPETLARYRVHGGNGFCGAPEKPGESERRKRAAAACCSRLVPPGFDWCAELKRELAGGGPPRHLYRRALAVLARDALLGRKPRCGIPRRAAAALLWNLLVGTGRSKAVPASVAREFGL